MWFAAGETKASDMITMWIGLPGWKGHLETEVQFTVASTTTAGVERRSPRTSVFMEAKTGNAYRVLPYADVIDPALGLLDAEGGLTIRADVKFTRQCVASAAKRAAVVAAIRADERTTAAKAAEAKAAEEKVAEENEDAVWTAEFEALKLSNSAR